jgi:hypothetical protein
MPQNSEFTKQLFPMRAEVVLAIADRPLFSAAEPFSRLCHFVPYLSVPEVEVGSCPDAGKGGG